MSHNIPFESGEIIDIIHMLADYCDNMEERISAYGDEAEEEDIANLATAIRLHDKLSEKEEDSNIILCPDCDTRHHHRYCGKETA